MLRPIRRLARDARRIAQGNLEHRVDWSSRDSLGVIASELNRIAVRLRELRDTEAGRRQMEFQLSDAVLQSIFEPIIVTDGKGHVLKVNQAAAELLGEAAGDRMALANTPGGDKILSAIRDAVSMQKAVAAGDEASMLPLRIGKQERSYRLRTTPMRDSDGRLLGTVTTLEDVTSCRIPTASRPSSSAWPAANCATRCFAYARASTLWARALPANCFPCRWNWSPRPAVRARSWTT